MWSCVGDHVWQDTHSGKKLQGFLKLATGDVYVFYKILSYASKILLNDINTVKCKLTIKFPLWCQTLFYKIIFCPYIIQYHMHEIVIPLIVPK